MLSKFKDLLNRGIDYVQFKFPPNRVVVLLTPLVFVPLAGSASAWVAEHFPGVELSEGSVIGFAGVAAFSAVALAYKWVDGWQAEEEAANDLFNTKQALETEAELRGER